MYEFYNRGGRRQTFFTNDGVGEVQILRMGSTVASGNWVKSSDGLAANLHTMVDEAEPPDFGDYIKATAAGTPAQLGVDTGHSPPFINTGWRIQFAHKAIGVAGVTYRLKEGATVIATWTFSPAPVVDTILDLDITPAQAAAVTNINALSVEAERI